jgi:hypothetical protein
MLVNRLKKCGVFRPVFSHLSREKLQKKSLFLSGKILDIFLFKSGAEEAKRLIFDGFKIQK